MEFKNFLFYKITKLINVIKKIKKKGSNDDFGYVHNVNDCRGNHDDDHGDDHYGDHDVNHGDDGCHDLVFHV